MRTLYLIFAFAVFATAFFPTASAIAQDADDDRVKIVVPATDGKVNWSEIGAAVVREAGVEIPILDNLPGGDLDLNATSTRLVLYTANKALKPAIRIWIDRPNDAIVIRIDRSELEAKTKQMGAALRENANQLDAKQTGLRQFYKSSDLKESEHIVVLVHGFNSSTDYMGTLAKQIKNSGSKKSPITVARFDYISRNGIQPAADLLDQELHKLVDQNPNCEISLVTHSMGGIVSRAAIEQEDFDIPQVKRIVMVAPPNHGTNLALLPTGADRFDNFLAKIDRTGIRKALRTFIAEANVAVEDLRPDSELLKTLNKGKRNSSIAYSILLGNAGALSSSDRKFLNKLVKQMRDSKETELIQAGNDLNAVMELLSPELLAKTGDGVVSVESGKLEGVQDVEVLSFQHSDVLKDDARAQRRIIREITKRLGSTSE